MDVSLSFTNYYVSLLRENLLSGFVESTLLFYLLFVPFEVLDHEIFSRQLKVIPVVIDPLRRVQVEIIQYFVDGITFDP